MYVCVCVYIYIYDPMKSAVRRFPRVKSYFTGCVKCKTRIITFTGLLKHLTVITTVSVQ